ncbi:MAG: hypothetical protein IPM54_42405 [Polyangiaceae bacterium]|nr:hypothetical protein [Polyangiaceae bacterium]
MVVNDCCTCAGIPVGSPAPSCPISECFAPACDASGLSAAAPLCRAGRCVIDADCNHDNALCDSLPPACPPGQTAHVNGPCWGGCVAVAECREVGACSQCTKDQACIENVAFVVERHCVDVPAACGGQIDCSCVGASSCISPYGVCTDPPDPAVLSCECPNC